MPNTYVDILFLHIVPTRVQETTSFSCNLTITFQLCECMLHHKPLGMPSAPTDLSAHVQYPLYQGVNGRGGGGEGVERSRSERCKV